METDSENEKRPMKSWMAELAAHYEKMRRRYPQDRLMLLFDIDGTILDMRAMVLYVHRTSIVIITPASFAASPLRTSRCTRIRWASSLPVCQFWYRRGGRFSRGTRTTAGPKQRSLNLTCLFAACSRSSAGFNCSPTQSWVPTRDGLKPCARIGRLGSTIGFMDVTTRATVSSMGFGGGVARGVRRPVTRYCSTSIAAPVFCFILVSVGMMRIRKDGRSQGATPRVGCSFLASAKGRFGTGKVDKTYKGCYCIRHEHKTDAADG